MSIRKNTWNLSGHYDLTNSGLNVYESPERALYTFGNNSSGELGQNNITQYSSPVQIPGVQWIAVSGSYNSSSGLKSDGTLWTWGLNPVGQLGLNNTQRISSPTQIPGTQWAKIEGGNGAIFSIKTDGTLWAWGANYSGQLGINLSTGTYRSSPVQIPGTQWSLVSNNRTQTLGLKTDGTLWAWGGSDQGQLGQNEIANQYSSPRQIPGTQWNSISSAYFRSYATKTDGTLWAWGRGAYGMLGQNDQTQYSSPRQIPGTQWSSVPLSMSYNAFAFKNDGTLWALGGYGEYGRLGQNNTTSRSSPVQIPGTQWNSFSGSYYVSVATKTDGTAWSWGRNYSGYLGHGDRIDKSSPTQIPGTQWTSVGVGGYTAGFTFLLKNP